MNRKFKILIVDDEDEQRESIRIILESKGFMVGEASSGGEALDLLEGEFYPLVLCDYIMPGINGLEVLKRIKKLYGESIEVIIITGYGDVESAVEAMKLGAFGYFIKGNNPDELILEIEKAKKILSLGKKHSLMDFRLICATNRDLIKEVKSNNFREDLFYRINTITIEIPPLRERKEDIEDMIYFFIDMFKEELKKDIYEIESNTLEYLLNYDYPGNIRELKNMIERLVVLSKNGILKMDNLGAINFPVKENIMNREVAPYEKAKEEFEREYFYNALKQHDFNVTHTANAIGISRRQLINKINKYNLRQEMGQ